MPVRRIRLHLTLLSSDTRSDQKKWVEELSFFDVPKRDILVESWYLETSRR